ncbi:YfiR family protein [Desulfogranum marinum]|uniref:YfiR family protein n=1 Tax=Desulfogranum marinum TaxID=453220 RepID=UPI0022B6BC32|nr:YfiR family protein [Desulfogranum marinum]
MIAGPDSYHNFLGRKALKRFSRSTVLFLLTFCWCASVPAAPRDEYAVKAAFVMNFAMLTEWPETAFSNPTENITLCVVGTSTLPQAFQSIEGKKIGKRLLHVEAVDSQATTPKCHIVFYKDEVDTADLVRTLSAVRGKPVLTVGEKERVTKLGGAIHFYTQNGKLKFAINPTVIAKQGLKLSSRLLKIATLIDN